MFKLSLDRQPKVYDEDGRPWYDTRQGITDSLQSLDGLLRLVAERHTAGYQRDERLNEFYIFGRYNLDTCGNCAKAIGIIPKEVLPGILDVMTRYEFSAYIKHANKKRKGRSRFSLRFAMNGGDLPLPGLKCAYCGETWNIQNCHDTVVRHTTQVFPLAGFVGQSLRDVKAAYGQQDAAIYRMQSDILIRNDNNIDLSPQYPNPEHEWEKSIVVNERGWLGEKDGIIDDYVIQPGDEGFFNVWKYFHGACNRVNLHYGEENQFRSIFEKAGFKDIRMVALPNEYCPCESCAPWFNVNTEFGTIKIGWRKRVINIDWSSMTETLQACGELPDQSFLSLFSDEDVTKGETGIHAWGWDAAQNYLSRIYRLLSPAPESVNTAK